MIVKVIRKIIGVFGLELNRIGWQPKSVLSTADLINFTKHLSRCMDTNEIVIVQDMQLFSPDDNRIYLANLSKHSLMDLEEFLLLSEKNNFQVIQIENFYVSFRRWN